MAQQTQIATVVPYFERFIAKFPTIKALADADEQAVLTQWQGLGYYRRARNLRAAARMIVDDLGGEVPQTVDALLQLPGVGRYTAGAIASVAYDLPAPIVDGNVARVFARYFLIKDAIDKPTTLKTLWALAQQLVETSGSPRDFNQAVMELGALVCTPRSAKCLVCPLRGSCRALAAGRVEQLPNKSPKKKPLAVTHTVLAVQRRGRLLFEQRPARGLWSNMWQLPTVEDTHQTPVEPVTYLRERFNLEVAPARSLTHFIHPTTHRTIRFELLRCAVNAGRLRPGSGQWRSLNNVGDLPLAKPQLTAIDWLGDLSA